MERIFNRVDANAYVTRCLSNDRFNLYFDWFFAPRTATERIELPVLDALSLPLCRDGRQMARRSGLSAICTCVRIVLIWTPHPLPINPRIPPATSVTSRRIATYRAAPFRALFRLDDKGALFSWYLNLPRIRQKKPSHERAFYTQTVIQIVLADNLINFFFFRSEINYILLGKWCFHQLKRWIKILIEIILHT